MLGIKDVCEVWTDLSSKELDDHLAPEMGDVLIEEGPKIYSDPVEFFKRTYFSDSILDVMEMVRDVLSGSGEGGARVFTIYSLFGGGKTHTLLCLLHAFRRPEALRNKEVLRGYDVTKRNRIVSISKSLEEVKEEIVVIPIHGKFEKLSGGRPSRPIREKDVEIRTVWGYLAHYLGKYDLVREDDENLTVPGIDKLREVLKEKNVLILIDEIVELAHTLKNSENESDRRYSENIPRFIDRLSSSLGEKSAMVITLPTEIRGEEIEEVEVWYSRETIEAFWRALRRDCVSIPPLRTEEVRDLVEVLRRRLFKKIDQEKMEEAIGEINARYDAYRDVFGSREIEKIRESYPFHPEFISILREIIERGELQKTRHFLMLSRIVLRKIWDSDENPSMIMPWHLSLENRELRRYLFKEPFTPYSQVSERVMEASRKLDPPFLYEVVLSSIFLKTYVYDSPKANPQFPTKSEVAYLCYDPNSFMMKDLNPTKIIDALDVASLSENVFYLNTDGERYWFWRDPGIKDYVMKQGERLYRENRYSVLEKFEEYVKTFSRGEFPRRGRRGRRRRKTERPEIFVLSDRLLEVIDSLERVVEDSPEYKTIFLLSPISVEANGYTYSIPRENPRYRELKEFMYRINGKSRNYRNTIVVCFPSNEQRLEECLRLTSLVMACEEIGEKLEEIVGIKDKDILSIQKKTLENMRNKFVDKLLDCCFKTFDRVAFPVRKITRTKSGC